MNRLIFGALTIVSFAVTAAPEQFSNINDLIEKYNDYPTYNIDGKSFPSFKVLSENPLHVQISPRTLAGSTAKDIEYASNKAAVYAAYRTLFQTSANKVKVTVLPLSITPQPRKLDYLSADKFDFSISKKQAFNLLKKNSSISSPQQLIADDGDWSKQFEACCYQEEGRPGLAKFAKDLTSQR
ncbi:hypothetical protein [Pseudescherichia vulneris]|uniref:hypothetical protein n=1 Tax=Pseudescherichia vulneris TaxID=566 RepID=UPI00301911FB